jgi:uncharacterized membrane protein AbrB (regulator of aidB expression)
MLSTKILKLYLIVLPVIFYMLIPNICLLVAFVAPIYVMFYSSRHTEADIWVIVDYVTIHCVFVLYLFIIVIWYACCCGDYVYKPAAYCIVILLTIVVVTVVIVTSYRLKKWSVVLYSMVPLFLSIAIGYCHVVINLCCD